MKVKIQSESIGKIIFFSLILVCTLIIAILGLGCISDDDPTDAATSSITSTPTVTPTVQVTQSISLYDEDMVSDLYGRSIPAVMTVHVIIENDSTSRNLLLPQQTGQGSGFLIDEGGHILTNYHVVENASKVQVTLNDGRTIDAEVLGTDREDDLALLKADAEDIAGITPLPLGDSDAVKPGHMAIALGAPFGLDGTITLGIVSGKGRSITGIANRPITDVIQTDAAINFGNSGGPLLNSSGEVIGINTAIAVSMSQASGIGYAVPINTAKSVLDSLIEGEDVHRPWLGIEGTKVTSDLAERLDLPVEEGAYIIVVSPDSPAEESGLRGSGTDRYGQATFGGDIVVGVDGEKVTEVEDLVIYFNTKQPGDTVTLSIIRGEKELSIEVTLAEWPETLTSFEDKSPFEDEFNIDPFEWFFPDDQ